MKSKFGSLLSSVCPSVWRRSSVSKLSMNFMHRFLSHFSCGLPWAIPRWRFFFHFWRKNASSMLHWNASMLHFDFFVFFNIGLSLEFQKAAPRSNCFWILQTSPKILYSVILIKSTVSDYWNFEFGILHEFFFAFVNMRPQISKRYSSLGFFQTSTDFLSPWSLQSINIGVFEILSFRFFKNFPGNFIFTIVTYRETKSFYYLQKGSSWNERERNLAFEEIFIVYGVLLTIKCSISVWGWS